MKRVAMNTAMGAGGLTLGRDRPRTKHKSTLFPALTAVLVAGFLLAGCGTSDLATDYFDPGAELTRDDFKQGMAAQEPAPSPEQPPPIPQLQPVISKPALGPEISSRRVTIAVTETTPLKDVLIELAREARIGLELDPRIEGGVIFSAYDRPFDEVLRRLSELAGLRFKLRDGVMRIELDDPYHTNYKLGYLSLVRLAASTVSTSAAVAGASDAASASKGAGNNSSSSSVNTDSEIDFWKELNLNITQILNNTATRTGLVSAPELVAYDPNSLDLDGKYGTSYSAGSGLLPLRSGRRGSRRIDTGASARSDTGPIDEGFLSDIRAQTRSNTGLTDTVSGAIATQGNELARQALARAAAASGTGAAIPGLTPAFTEASNLFSVNRQAGIVSVFGTERQHRLVETYLRWLRKSIGAQVLIEAKILEVFLDDEFRFGINWATLFDGRTNAAAPFNAVSTTTVQAPPFSPLIGSVANPITATANVFTFATGGADLNVIANAVEQFGTVRALSSPRLTVMQNQTAVLKVAENDVYFEVSVDQTTQVGINQTVVSQSVESTLKTVTVGLVMTVQPSINLETDEITLSLRPTITKIVRRVNDPAVELQNIPGVVSQVPVISVQEIDSVVTVASGNVIVMGGLMQDQTTVTEFGIPLLSDIPWIGRAFKSTDRVTTKSELVIFLRATIVRNDSVDAYDIKLYDQFGQDRRPLTF